jgi:membrane-bound lytic murein transglycosylase A
MNFLMLMMALIISGGIFAQEITPTVRVQQSMSFADDLDFEKIEKAIDRQLEAYDRMGLNGTIKFGTKTYSRKVLETSLISLKALAQEFKNCLLASERKICQQQFDLAVNEKFAIYRPSPSRKESGYKQLNTTKYTSYYSPDLVGSRVKTERFKHAVYRMPEDPQLANSSRVEIDYKGALQGYELFWVEQSLYDLYLLHVQGGGRIKVINPDGTHEMKYLSYAGKNSLKFQMVYKYLISKGYLKPEEASINNQRKWFEENPDKAMEVWSTCPSYVYFKESDEEPVGLDNIPLTEGRSLAFDSRIYKTTGLINFVKTQKASHVEDGKVVKVPFSRFFIAQDTGGAIRGNARCDLYFGYGPLAELTAYNMNEMGEQYFLVLK